MSTHSSKGFHIVEGVMIAAALGVLVALGAAFYTASTKHSAPSASTQPAGQASVQTSVPTIKATSDLDAASTDLNQIDLQDTNDTTQLDAQQAAF